MASGAGAVRITETTISGAAGGIFVGSGTTTLSDSVVSGSDGQPIPGYEVEACKRIVGDEIERVVQWNGQRGSDVGSLAGKAIRLRFVMQDADLFAIRFH